MTSKTKRLQYRKSACLVILLAAVIIGCIHRPRQVLISDEIAEKALTLARTKLNAPYVLGGRGPNTFDCSGLIIWSYKKAVGKDNIFRIGHRITTDANMKELYIYNVQMIPPESARPGDIVFITDGSKDVTHGGLFMGWKDANTLEFINASSYEAYQKVVIDTWPIHEIKRDQYFVGIGRLLMVP